MCPAFSYDGVAGTGKGEEGWGREDRVMRKRNEREEGRERGFAY